MSRLQLPMRYRVLPRAVWVAFIAAIMVVLFLLVIVLHVFHGLTGWSWYVIVPAVIAVATSLLVAMCRRRLN